MKTEDVKNLEPIIEERSSYYGDPTFAHANLGLLWTGIIQNHYGIELPRPVSAELVHLLMVASKLNRIAVAHREDDYDDARCYLRLANLAKGKEDEEKITIG